MNEEVYTLQHIIKNLKMEILCGKPIKLQRDLVWRTAAKQNILISEMNDTHIYNTIKCLKGEGNFTIPAYYYGKSRDQWLKIFKNELSKRVK